MSCFTDRIVREPERKFITGISSAGAWRGERAGTFPSRIRLGENSVGWKLSDLMAWVESRKASSSAERRPVAIPGPGKRRGRPRKNTPVGEV